VLWLALALRLAGITQQSIWYDEGLSIYSARGGISHILSASAASEHPPLHALLLALWIRACGDSEFAVRYLSAWWSVLAVALIARLASGRSTDRRSALIPTFAPLLLALSPFSVWYAQETRGYSMALALATAAVLVGRASLSPPGESDPTHRRAWPGALAYCLLAVAALYTHLYTAFVLLALNLVLLVQHLRARHWPTALTWAVSQAAVLLLFAPWLPTVAAQWQLNATYFHGAVDWKQIVRRTLLALSVGEAGQGPWAIGAGVAYLCLVSLGTISLVRDKQARWSALLHWLWMLVPLTFQIALNRRLPKFSPRYMLNLLPPFLLLAAAGARALLAGINRAARLPPPRRRAQTLAWIAAAAVLLAATAMIGGATTRALANQMLDTGQYRPDVRAVAHYIEDHATPNDLIVLLAGYNAPAFNYYYRGPLLVLPLPDKLLPDTRAPLDVRALETLDAAIAGKDRLWLVLWQDALADPTGLVTDELQHTYPRLGVGRTFHDVALLLFDVSSGPRLSQSSAPSVLLNADLGDPASPAQVRLVGFDLDRQTVRPGETLYLYLYWQALADMRHDYKVFTQLLAAGASTGTRIAAQQDEIAGAATYPTSHWPVGALVRDRFLLTLAADTPPGPYTLIAGLYRPGREPVRLHVYTLPGGQAGQDHVVLAQINVE
jgi:4-amino-4-deoxy-L-arabinose transferase-like glycosyltransferase